MNSLNNQRSHTDFFVRPRRRSRPQIKTRASLIFIIPNGCFDPRRGAPVSWRWLHTDPNENIRRDIPRELKTKQSGIKNPSSDAHPKQLRPALQEQHRAEGQRKPLAWAAEHRAERDLLFPHSEKTKAVRISRLRLGLGPKGRRCQSVPDLDRSIIRRAVEANRQEWDQPSVSRHDGHRDRGQLECRVLEGQQDRPAPAEQRRRRQILPKPQHREHLDVSRPLSAEMRHRSGRRPCLPKICRRFSFGIAASLAKTVRSTMAISSNATERLPSREFMTAAGAVDPAPLTLFIRSTS